MTEVDVDLGFVDQLVEEKGTDASRTIPLLQGIQEHYGWLPPAALERLREITDITPAQIAGVSTFYTQFRHKPAGKHRVKVCIGTACHVKGAEALYQAFRAVLNIEDENEDTDADGIFTVEKVACLGCCMLAPAVQIDDLTYGHVTNDNAGQVLQDFLAAQGEDEDDSGPGHTFDDSKPLGQIRISLDTCCLASGADKVARAIGHVLNRTGAPAVLKGVGCWGKSYLEPMIEVVEPGKEPIIYQGVQPDNAEAIVLRHFRPESFTKRAKARISGVIDSLLTDESWDTAEKHAVCAHHPSVQAFDSKQVRIATEYCGQTRPTDLEEYLKFDGFSALRKAITSMTPQQVVEEVYASKLRGRGGAGYPTGLKWRQVRKHESDVKYVVCNGDEGDPGAFMDRMLLESQPYRIIEGMALAAYGVGATHGYCYIRAEYPIAVARLLEAIDKCRQEGYLGENIFDSGFSFELDIMEGAGAFVCGEETALLASMEGRRGMPRLRPPYPAESGLWHKPTLVNNTETLSMIPWVIRHGAGAFTKLGTETSKGTKVFALAGKIYRGGLVEVPMGMTIREIVDEVGGGIPDGHQLKAVQIGGPSGGCVPASLADTPIDYEALTSAGAIMGSGGLVVLDETDCMVDIARYFLEFTQDESCGKCTFCRVGTRHMLDILTRLCEGNATAKDLERLETLCHDVPAGSLCGLGKTAPNPVISTLTYFRNEYEAHVAGKCPAGKCKELISYRINEDCIGCTRCAQNCPVDAIPMKPYQQHEIDDDLCIRCDMCRQVCPVDAVEVE
ncbi:MAG: NAD(P)H-dependent oxidoreductase subunit E [Phycisphaerae bacterium]